MKRRNWYFTLLYLLPLLVALLPLVFNTFALSDGVVTFATNAVAAFRFSPVADVLDDVMENFGTWNVPCVSAYISYLVCITLIRIVYECLMFLPKWAISMIERWSNKA